MVTWTYRDADDVYTEPKEYLKIIISKHHSSSINLRQSGCQRIMGECISFHKYLKKFLYKQYGSWYEVYAINKSELRKNTYGKIDSIIELKED